MTAAAAIAALGCAIWLYLLAGRGGFWRAAQRDDVGMPASDEDMRWPAVVAVIPARDEAVVIGDSLQSLLGQDYPPGRFSVIVVDDHSSDGTAAIAQRVAASGGVPGQVSVLAAPPLPQGWTGKSWAVHCGVRRVETLDMPAEYLLLTDADIVHAGDTLTTLVRRAVRGRLVLTSLMARLRCVSFAERALLPAFVFFFEMLYPFAWVNRSDRKTAAAAGGCMLVERRALLDAGGIEAIRSQLIDDCALARLLKRRGGAIWLGLSKRVASARAAPSIGDIRRLVARSAFAQLGYSPWWLLVVTVAMLVTCIAPALLALFTHGPPQLLGGIAWVQMAFAFLPIVRFYGLSPWWSLALPAIAGVYLLFTWDSAWQHLRGGGGQWKGRVYRASS